MFEGLSGRLQGIADGLTGRGVLTVEDVDQALVEIRRCLIEADVAASVAADFVALARPRVIGNDVIRSVQPGQQAIKVIRDVLAEFLGDGAALALDGKPPQAIMMLGLQGSGKTTTAAKIALRLTREKKRVLLCSLDTRRPAAQEQLAILAQENGIDCLPVIAGQSAIAIAKRARATARLSGYDVYIVDTAGRTTLDEDLMNEAAEIKAIIEPAESLLIADSLTGQDAVNLAQSFSEQVGITGLVLTRVDGDARGGALVSMRAVTGKPIKYLGVGEKVDALETFDPVRMANRILAMGDVISLVEKAAANYDEEKAKKAAASITRGQFSLDDLVMQLEQMVSMGGASSIMDMLPGMASMKKKAAGMLPDNKSLQRQIASVSSMTRGERNNPKLLNFSRKKRVAAGSGTSLEDINKLLKMHRQMADAMKAMRGKGGLAKMFGGNMLGKLGGLGGLTDAMKTSNPSAMSFDNLPSGQTLDNNATADSANLDMMLKKLSQKPRN